MSETIKPDLSLYINPNAQAWLDALRSGNYQQGRCQLHYAEGDKHFYCCLGVACELAKEAGIVPSSALTPFGHGPVRVIYDYAELPHYLPSEVMDWLGLRSGVGGSCIIPNGDSLASMNDSWGYSFNEIADEIEANAAEIFVPVAEQKHDSVDPRQP